MPSDRSAAAFEPTKFDRHDSLSLISIKSSSAKPGLKDTDMYGSGFIYEKNRLRGKIATCVVKTQKEDGDALHLITSCSTNVALATVQFSLKDNALVPLGSAGKMYQIAGPEMPRLDRIAAMD